MLLVRQSRSEYARAKSVWADARLRLGKLVIVLLGLQFALGMADVLLLAPAWMQLLHLLGADLYWVALVLLAAETIWPAETLALSKTDPPSPTTTAVA